jgi:hypothetical protein
VNIHQLLDACERLTHGIATEFHKDAAVQVQFNAGAWPAFQNAVAAARAAHGPTPPPEAPAAELPEVVVEAPAPETAEPAPLV